MTKRFEMKLPRHLRTMLCALLLVAPLATANAQLTIDINKPNFEPKPIAIVDFAGDRTIGADIAGVVRNDLQNSGLFRSIPPGSFIQKDVNPNGAPRFPDWRGIGAEGLVVGQITQVGGNIKVDFRLWDVVVGNQLTGFSYTSQPANWRRLAHIIADIDLNKRVTGEEGYFDTRVAYVSEDRPGEQPHQAHRHHGPRMAPTTATSPTVPRSPYAALLADPQELVYMAYNPDRTPPKVYLQNVDSGRRELLGNFPGMSSAPALLSPDGTKVAMGLFTGWSHQHLELTSGACGLRRLTKFAGHRHLAVLFQRRHADRVQFRRPRRQPAALRHECERRRRETHQLRRGSLRPRRCGRHAAITSLSPR
jgi:TolB protein